MKMHLYYVYDRMADEYGPIFEQRNHGVARRTFEQMVQKWAGRPEEYRLYCVGDKDQETGLIHIFDKEEVPLDGSL